MLNGLDLFSGIGGLSLALEPWVRTIAYCENDKYAEAVLLQRMGSGALGVAPIWDDIRTLRADAFMVGNASAIDIVIGGFPCQDISVAGTGKGLDGKRSGLFFEITRLVYELRPRFVFLENVPAITTRGGIRVVSEFTRLGYDCRWTILSAAELGACHLRKRWFMLAHAYSEQLWKPSNRFTECNKTIIASEHGVARRDPDTSGKGLEGPRRIESGLARPAAYNGWSSEPVIRGRNNGIPYRVDRIRGLGNAVVPMQARTAFKRLMGLR